MHALYPKGFTKNDLPIIDKHIADTPGLSMNPAIKKVSWESYRLGTSTKTR